MRSVVWPRAGAYDSSTNPATEISAAAPSMHNNCSAWVALRTLDFQFLWLAVFAHAGWLTPLSCSHSCSGLGRGRATNLYHNQLGLMNQYLYCVDNIFILYITFVCYIMVK